MLSLSIAAAPTVAVGETPANKPRLETVLKAAPFSAGDFETLRKRGTVTTPAIEVSDRQLAIGVGCLVPAGGPTTLDVMRSAPPEIPGVEVEVAAAIDSAEPNASLIRVEEGLLLFVTASWVWVDVWNGFGTSVKRSIGRKRMGQQLLSTARAAGYCPPS